MSALPAWTNSTSMGGHRSGLGVASPALELPRRQFLLVSATLGDMTTITADLEARSGRAVTSVTSVHRPTPLYHQWRTTTVADSVKEAVAEGLFPVYVVHANQAAAIERAQALVSRNVSTRAQREAIAGRCGACGWDAASGSPSIVSSATVSASTTQGCSLATVAWLSVWPAQGLLPVICGTDTLGVGVNIPIRTVLMTALTKFDGNRVRRFTVREFHQLAGRGRTARVRPRLGTCGCRRPSMSSRTPRPCRVPATTPRHAAGRRKQRPRRVSCTTTRPRWNGS